MLLPQALGPLQTCGWPAGTGIFKALSETSKGRNPLPYWNQLRRPGEGPGVVMRQSQEAPPFPGLSLSLVPQGRACQRSRWSSARAAVPGHRRAEQGPPAAARGPSEPRLEKPVTVPGRRGVSTGTVVKVSCFAR